MRQKTSGFVSKMYPLTVLWLDVCEPRLLDTAAKQKARTDQA